ncbi:MAG: 16S rRNA (guanine(527)-N(7))-methyltransferase RsmG, partial [Pygmaiobacter sp.]
MIDKKRLIARGASYGMDLAPIASALEQYASLLVEYNKKVNLTAITDAEGIENKHFIDSLLLAQLPEVSGRLVDVGTGAGFPGVVAKLYKPDLQLTLMEPTGKRLDFLRYLCGELGIEAEFVKERAEEAARKQWREQFDVATARGVAALPMLSEYCVPLVKVGGVFIAMKGNDAAELAACGGALATLGAQILRREERKLPDGAARSLILVKKISQTSTVYPRSHGKMVKN